MKTLILLILLPVFSWAKIVMIIDTPVNKHHVIFTNENIKQFDNDNKPVQKELKDHGTHILSLIIAGKNQASRLKLQHQYIVCTSYTDAAIFCYQLALALNVDVINYSGGGHGEALKEKSFLEKLNNRGVKMFFAAGNDGKDLRKYPYYPASYAPLFSNITAVSNKNSKGVLDNSSNYAPYTKAYEGVNLKGAGYDVPYTYNTGTSQATALATHEYLRSLEK